jgi:hypothetical protein
MKTVTIEDEPTVHTYQSQIYTSTDDYTLIEVVSQQTDHNSP